MMIKNANLIKINLGCGSDYLPGYINVDNNSSVKAEVYCDLNKKLPFKTNYADEIYCRNLFEHIPNPLNFLLEMKRVLKKGGRALITTSNASYFIYHFPRRKAYHDSYNLTSHKDDKHYFMFQRGHFIAFTKKAGLKLVFLDYIISNRKKGKDYYFQKIMSLFIGKKFAYSDFIWIVEK